MNKLTILNSKEKRSIAEVIEERFGARLEHGHAFLRGNDGRINIITEDFSRIDEKKLRIDSVGMYLGTLKDGYFRPSIEGSQMIGPTATKNILEIDEGLTKLWLRGHDIMTAEPDSDGFVLVKHDADFMGAGKIKAGKVINYFPKTRRITSAD